VQTAGTASPKRSEPQRIGAGKLPRRAMARHGVSAAQQIGLTSACRWCRV
jgi:hypothetical protein